ncbi:MAG: hypothetical protein IKL21_00390 [Clostridia bacterium]|nr:hypothetical protein [Clostridia bacterium]
MKKLTMLIAALLCASMLFSCAKDTATGTDTTPDTNEITNEVTDNADDTEDGTVTDAVTDAETDAETEPPMSDEEYKKTLMDKGFPESYAVLLCDIHKRFPSWQFNPIMITDLSGGKYTWDYVIGKEIEDDENNTVYHTLEGVLDYAIDTKPVESGIWFRAKPESVRFFMDPRNFLDEKNMFMFERLNSDTVTYSATVVESLLEGTFMFRKNMGDEGSNMKYSECFVEVAKNLGISPLVIAARLRQEQGVNGTSPLISGTCGDTLWQYYSEKSNNAPASGYTEAQLKSYNGYYNFFNIQATGNGYFEVFLAGMNEARQGGWTSKYKAVEGGAAKLKSRYIDDYQQTLYFQKFNVDPRSGRNFWGQYMQAVHAAYDEARSTYNAYRRVNMLGSEFVFDIPVYAGMPAEPCPNPGTRYS